jgi:hypothetical protein
MSAADVGRPTITDIVGKGPVGRPLEVDGSLSEFHVAPEIDLAVHQRERAAPARDQAHVRPADHPELRGLPGDLRRGAARRGRGQRALCSKRALPRRDGEFVENN